MVNNTTRGQTPPTCFNLVVRVLICSLYDSSRWLAFKSSFMVEFCVSKKKIHTTKSLWFNRSLFSELPCQQIRRMVERKKMRIKSFNSPKMVSPNVETKKCGICASSSNNQLYYDALYLLRSKTKSAHIFFANYHALFISERGKYIIAKASANAIIFKHHFSSILTGIAPHYAFLQTPPQRSNN